MNKQQTTLKKTHDNLVQASTLVNVSIKELEMVRGYLESIGHRSPASAIYADILVAILEKLTDADTLIINSK